MIRRCLLAAVMAWALAAGAKGAGADDLIIEVNPDPEHASSDGPQSLKPKKFAELMVQMAKVAEAVGRSC